MSKKIKYIVFPLSVLLIAGVSFLLLMSSTSHQSGKENENQTNTDLSSHYHLYSPSIPETLEFAGEKVPLDRYDVRESLDRELLVNVYWQSNLLLYCKRSYRYFPLIESILKKEGVPDDFKYLALIESGLTNAVSPAKATGFWQFMKETGISYGLEINDEVDERYHVEKSTYAACQYLKRSYKQHGTWSLAAAAYNMGDGGVKRQIERQKQSSYWDLLLNDETARYMYRILAAKILLSNPQSYGIKLQLTDLYQPLTVRTITVNTPIDNWVDFAAKHNMTYKEFKALNPWLRSDKLTNKSGKTYTITLIEQKDTDFGNQIKSLDKNQMLEGF